MEKGKSVFSVLGVFVMWLAVFLAVFFFFQLRQQSAENKVLTRKLTAVKSDKEVMADKLTLYEEEKEAVKEQLKLEQAELESCLSQQKLSEKNFLTLIQSGDKQIRELTQEKNFLGDNTKELTTNLRKIILENNRLQKRLDELKAKKSALSSELSEISMQMDIIRKEAKSLQNNLLAERKIAGQKLTSFRRQKQELVDELERNKTRLENLRRRLAQMKSDIEMLVGKNARLRTELKRKNSNLSKIEVIADKLTETIKAVSPKIIATVYFSTNEWKLTKRQKADLDVALRQMDNRRNDYFVIIKGSSDCQRFSGNSRHKNLRLSVRRSLAIENYLAKNQSPLPIEVMGMSNIFSPTEPVNNPNERAAIVYLVSKNPPNLDGLLTDLRDYLRTKK